jgi:integrase
VSDFNHLRDVHIDGEYFRITTQKTGAQVVIPIHPIIRRIIASGFDISTPVSDQKINQHIKEVARMAGITQLVEGTKYIDHRAVVGFFPKCDLITTHTARRSAATNMYKAGIPSISIMRITGHTTEKSFMKYIKITAEENAEMMARNAFFMG